MRFSVWDCSDGECHSFQMSLTTAGQPKDGVFQYEFEAATWEEAMAIFHIRMGWEPYNPGCEPEMCPVHKDENVVHYPAGSGQCWKCETEKSAKLAPTSDFDRGVEMAAKHVEAHCSSSSCCNAQPSSIESAQLAACVRKIRDV